MIEYEVLKGDSYLRFFTNIYAFAACRRRAAFYLFIYTYSEWKIVLFRKIVKRFSCRCIYVFRFRLLHRRVVLRLLCLSEIYTLYLGAGYLCHMTRNTVTVVYSLSVRYPHTAILPPL